MKLVFIILVVNELTFFKLIFNIHKEYEVFVFQPKYSMIMIKY